MCELRYALLDIDAAGKRYTSFPTHHAFPVACSKNSERGGFLQFQESSCHALVRDSTVMYTWTIALHNIYAYLVIYKSIAIDELELSCSIAKVQTAGAVSTQFGGICHASISSRGLLW